MPNDARIRITRIVAPGELTDQIVPKMENLGRAMAVRAQRLVPKRTWALHDTITTETERRGNEVVTTVSAGDERVDYPVFVERGTSRQKAQPYLRPALAQTTGKDLDYSGTGPTAHGVVSLSTRRSRLRKRSGR